MQVFLFSLIAQCNFQVTVLLNFYHNMLNLSVYPLLKRKHFVHSSSREYLNQRVRFVVGISTYWQWTDNQVITNCGVKKFFLFLKDRASLFLISHHQQISYQSSTNVVKIQPCVYFSRSQNEFLSLFTAMHAETGYRNTIGPVKIARYGFG